MLNEHFSFVFTVVKGMDALQLGEVEIDVMKRVAITEEKGLVVLKSITVDASPEPVQLYPSTL